jgi:hypothetical protein
MRQYNPIRFYSYNWMEVSGQICTTTTTTTTTLLLNS